MSTENHIFPIIKKIYRNFSEIKATVCERRALFSGFCWWSKQFLPQFILNINCRKRSSDRAAKAFINQLWNQEELCRIMDYSNGWVKKNDQKCPLEDDHLDRWIFKIFFILMNTFDFEYRTHSICPFRFCGTDCPEDASAIITVFTSSRL